MNRAHASLSGQGTTRATSVRYFIVMACALSMHVARVADTEDDTGRRSVASASREAARIRDTNRGLQALTPAASPQP